MPFHLIPIALAFVCSRVVVSIVKQVNIDSLSSEEKEEFEYLKSEAEKGKASKLSEDELRRRLKDLI